MGTLSWLDLGLCFIIYSFLGWVAEVLYYAVTKRRFYNRGFLTLPLLPTYGITFCVMALALPSLEGNYLLQFLDTLIVASVVESLTGHLARRAAPKLHWGEEPTRLFSGKGLGVLISVAIAGIHYCLYLVFHPFLLTLLALIPRLAREITVIAVLALVVLDMLAVFFAVRKGDAEGFRRRQEAGGQSKLAHRLTDAVWRRLQKAYPGIADAPPEEQGQYVFAKGLCLDKLIWVFLVSALLGDLIETLYCRLVGGTWMSRSSVLYGPFSFVWGIGAVVLTVSLRRLAGKSDRYVFLGGFVIGGTYEYLCSVFTELVFGTVFWDYSDMVLNVGGRTNVLFCFFWGVLAVVWIKILYPPMSQAIEKLPAVTGKVLTWILVFLMACNALLTVAAMLRYESRAQRPESANQLEEFLDRRYDDDYVERRWPNMIAADASSREP